jgi:hypothetical protein
MKGNVKIKKGTTGLEIKTAVGIKIEASLWNEAMKKAFSRGTTLNALIREFIIALNNDSNSIEIKETKIDIKKISNK